mmetsp:Transcript_16194/g.50240  ORF Transcript_16194/g.50240 Transcript_16194/m.50240 type:complete len:386 (-) Transcript_16194:1721-2878(-)
MAAAVVPAVRPVRRLLLSVLLLLLLLLCAASAAADRTGVRWGVCQQTARAAVVRHQRAAERPRRRRGHQRGGRVRSRDARPGEIDEGRLPVDGHRRRADLAVRRVERRRVGRGDGGDDERRARDGAPVVGVQLADAEVLRVDRAALRRRRGLGGGRRALVVVFVVIIIVVGAPRPLGTRRGGDRFEILQVANGAGRARCRIGRRRLGVSVARRGQDACDRGRLVGRAALAHSAVERVRRPVAAIIDAGVHRARGPQERRRRSADRPCRAPAQRCRGGRRRGVAGRRAVRGAQGVLEHRRRPGADVIAGVVPRRAPGAGRRGRAGKLQRLQLVHRAVGDELGRVRRRRSAVRPRGSRRRSHPVEARAAVGGQLLRAREARGAAVGA